MKNIDENGRRLIVLCGKSGSGKDFLSSRFGMVYTPGNTTRPKRLNDSPNYTFWPKAIIFDKKEAHKLGLNIDINIEEGRIVQNPIIETLNKKLHGIVVTYFDENLYWTWKEVIEDYRYDYMIVDLDGLKEIVSRYNSGEFKRGMIFLYFQAPIWKRVMNMRERGDDWKKIWKRLKNDRIKFKGGLKYIKTVKNGELVRL